MAFKKHKAARKKIGSKPEGESQPGRLKSALLSWLGVPIELTTGTFWQEWYGTSNSGKVVSVDKAIQLSAVWACVRLLSETISTLPLKIYERQADGSRLPALNHPLYKILCRSPNKEMTPSRFMLFVVASVVLRGNAFVEKRMINGRIVALWPLLPQNMVVQRIENGSLQYTYAENGGTRNIPENNLMHIRGFGLDGVTGMMPVGNGADVIGSAISLEEAAGKIFDQGLQSSGFIQSKEDLTKDQRQRLRDNLQNFMGSKNAGKVMVLEGSLTYQGITMNPEAAQMLQSRGHSVEEICRWFRVPPFMVGHADKQSSWASSVEGMNLQFLTNTLRPILVNIEQEIERCLLVNDDQFFASFSVEGLLRADSASRIAFYAAAIRDGWMNRNDVRQKENLPPIPGGEKFTVQLNLTTLEKVGEDTPDGEQARTALSNWLFPEGIPSSKAETEKQPTE